MTDTSADTHDDEGRMTLFEHLTELRKRLIYCLIAVCVTTVIMFFLYPRVLHFLAGPYEQVTRGDRACGGNAKHGCDLIVTGPLDPFLIRLKLAGYGGMRSRSRSSSGRSGGS